MPRDVPTKKKNVPKEPAAPLPTKKFDGLSYDSDIEAQQNEELTKRWPRGNPYDEKVQELYPLKAIEEWLKVPVPHYIPEFIPLFLDGNVEQNLETTELSYFSGLSPERCLIVKVAKSSRRKESRHPQLTNWGGSFLVLTKSHFKSTETDWQEAQWSGLLLADWTDDDLTVKEVHKNIKAIKNVYVKHFTIFNGREIEHKALQLASLRRYLQDSCCDEPDEHGRPPFAILPIWWE